MPRTLDPAAHALRRDAFIDVALRLIHTKGYEQMSIEGILGELDASKGAFYHYFDSKEALLAAVVDRIVDAATATMAPIADDPGMPALEKLNCLFSTLSAWKAERKELMTELLRVWLSDGNTVVREQLRHWVGASLTPLLTRVVRQGTAEGIFTSTSPEHAAGVLVTLVLGANEFGSRMFLSRQAGTITFDEVERTLAAYSEAFERILGLPPGSWELVDSSTVHLWFD
jgi:AcrR family transcriptional regulator